MGTYSGEGNNKASGVVRQAKGGSVCAGSKGRQVKRPKVSKAQGSHGRQAGRVGTGRQQGR